MRRFLTPISILFFISGAFLYTRTPDIGPNLPLFYSGFILSSAGYLGLLYRGLPRKKFAWWGLLFLLIFLPRIFALNLTPSDDIPRYIWEGRVLLEGYSPYSVSPDDPRLIELRDESFCLINHKDMPAIYPPLTQYIFTAVSVATRSVYDYRLFVLLIEIISIALMLVWLKLERLPLDRILIYALNPLVIIGIAGHGHLDPLQVVILAGGLYLYSKGKTGSGMLIVTFAGLIKFLAFFALPFMVKRRTLKHLPLCALTVIVSYLPFFFLKGGFSFGNMRIYVGEFEYYSLTFAILRWLAGTAGAHVITAVILFAVMASLYLTRTKIEHAMLPFLFLVTLMSTTVHYWYIIPLLALSIVAKSRPLIALSLLFMPYFDVFEKFTNEGIWEGEWWRQFATYVPFLVIFWLEKSGRWFKTGARKYSLGVVIPALNDEAHLRKLFKSIEKSDIDPSKIVVVDGGSNDNSVEVAEKWGTTVIKSATRGRGNQIAEGISKLDTELVLIVHADNEVPSDIRRRIVNAANAYQDSAGGSCRMEYDPGSIKSKLLAVLSNAKTALLGLSFGDSGQWFHKSRIEFPALPLMEDVELAIRINDRGHSVWTPCKLTVSTRRYARKGFIPVALSVIARTSKYLFQRRWYDKIPDTKSMYKEYYANAPGKS
ncbi:MAG: glycosyltransferase [candidate division Zixibacteria bacterium]|nr:glycosyltransferase [candidate division Zixibacteria bacterium]